MDIFLYTSSLVNLYNTNQAIVKFNFTISFFGHINWPKIVRCHYLTNTSKSYLFFILDWWN
jgi:hypothetical protein